MQCVKSKCFDTGVIEMFGLSQQKFIYIYIYIIHILHIFIHITIYIYIYIQRFICVNYNCIPINISQIVIIIHKYIKISFLDSQFSVLLANTTSILLLKIKKLQSPNVLKRQRKSYSIPFYFIRTFMLSVLLDRQQRVWCS